MKDVENLMLTFTCVKKEGTEHRIVELVENGSEIIVNDENKKDYVKRYCKFILIDQFKEQIEAFKKGFLNLFGEIDIKSILSYRELISFFLGDSKIVDVEYLKKKMKYEDCSDKDQMIIWFWQIFEEWNDT